MNRSRSAVLSASIVGVLFLSGCGRSGPNRMEVTGTVDYDGKPVPAGQIYFDPDTKRGADGPQGFAHIKNGVFDTRDQGRGPVAGPHIVRIFGFDGAPRPEKPQGLAIFREWQTTVDVDPAKPTFEFIVPHGGGKSP